MGLAHNIVPRIEQSRMEETFRCHDGVEVERCESFHQLILRVHEVGDKVLVQGDPVGPAHPLEPEGQLSVPDSVHVLLAIVENLLHSLTVVKLCHDCPWVVS